MIPFIHLMNQIGVVPSFKTSALYNYNHEELENFLIVNGQLYHGDSGGVLVRALSLTKEKDKLYRIHEPLCANDVISLYQRFRGNDFIA